MMILALGLTALAAQPLTNWDQNLCRLAQQTVVKGLDSADIDLSLLDDSSFPSKKTDITGGRLQILGNLHGTDNLVDRTVDCKLLAADRVIDQTGKPVQAGGSCADVNQLTLDYVLSQVSPEVKSRYLASGRQLRFDADVQTTTGGEWIRTEVAPYQKAVGKQVQIRSITLQVPWNAPANDPTTGVNYCKLLSAASVSRWVESLALDAAKLPLPVLPVTCVPRFEKDQGSCRFSPPFLEEEICQDYTGLAWNAVDISSDCRDKEGVYSEQSCASRTDGSLGADFGRCVIQCSKPSEKIWHFYSDPSKYGIDMNQVCDRFPVAPKAPALEFPVKAIPMKIAGDDSDVYVPQKATPSPLLIFFQGGRVDKRFYAEYAREVAAAGFLVVVPNHFSTLFDDPELFSEITQIPLIQKEIQQLNQQVGSTLFGSWNTDQFGLIGHSFGAAAIIDALQSTCRFPFCGEDSFQKPANLKAVALTGINTKPIYGDEIFPTANQGLPIAFINGQNDSNATYADTQTSFQMIETPPKMLVAIKGANHYNLTDVNSPAGPKPDEAEMQIPQSYAIRLSSYWTVQFLRAHILNDAEALQAIYSVPNFEDLAIIRSSVLK